jgi:HAD superfamily hydrolase (TIGR01549 family)
MNTKNDKISFVYFDVGGVLLLDYSGTDKWLQMKRSLGVTEDLDEQFDSIWKSHRSRICIDCDVDTIIPEFKEKVGINIPDEYSMLSDFVNRFDLNPSIHDIALKSKEKYKIGLLTNMYPRMLSLIKEKKLIPELSWDSEVDSSVVGFQKPESGIFEIAEQMAQTDPSQIFFVDNSSEHVKAAQKSGWKTFLYDSQNPEQSSVELARILDIKLD